MKRLRITVDGAAYDVTVEEVGSDPPAPAAAPAVTAPALHLGSDVPGEVASPLAGTILQVGVTVGQAVKAGDPVLLLEAMKMESVIVAPASGSVISVSITVGASVQEGQILLTIG